MCGESPRGETRERGACEPDSLSRATWRASVAVTVGVAIEIAAYSRTPAGYTLRVRGRAAAELRRGIGEGERSQREESGSPVRGHGGCSKLGRKVK